MATKQKHMERSHRSHRNRIPDGMFSNHAAVRANSMANRQRASIFAQLFHRKLNLTGESTRKEETPT